MDRTQQIAELNDRCRQYLGASGRLVVSSGIASLDPDKQRRILMRVQNHRRFDEGNDPYGEHDFGAFESDDGSDFLEDRLRSDAHLRQRRSRRSGQDAARRDRHVRLGILSRPAPPSGGAWSTPRCAAGRCAVTCRRLFARAARRLRRSPDVPMSFAAKRSASYSERSEHSPIMCPTRIGTGSGPLRGLQPARWVRASPAGCPGHHPDGGRHVAGVVAVREVAELVREQVPIRGLIEQVARYNDVAPGRPGAGAPGEPKDRGPPGRESPCFTTKRGGVVRQAECCAASISDSKAACQAVGPLLSSVIALASRSIRFSILHRPTGRLLNWPSSVKRRPRWPSSAVPPPRRHRGFIPAGWGSATSCRAFLSAKEWPARARSRGFRGISSLHCGIPTDPWTGCSKTSPGWRKRTQQEITDETHPQRLCPLTPSEKAARVKEAPLVGSAWVRTLPGRVVSINLRPGIQRLRRAGAVRNQRGQLTRTGWAACWAAPFRMAVCAWKRTFVIINGFNGPSSAMKQNHISDPFGPGERAYALRD